VDLHADLGSYVLSDGHLGAVTVITSPCDLARVWPLLTAIFRQVRFRDPIQPTSMDARIWRNWLSNLLPVARRYFDERLVWAAPSLPVIVHTTPGNASAAEVSTLMIRAWAYGERTKRRYAELFNSHDISVVEQLWANLPLAISVDQRIGTVFAVTRRSDANHCAAFAGEVKLVPNLPTVGNS
jgi:hypothetical protein